ncbi:hypothetical protein DV738_g3312, partial [Chaetothyriales sp. CBS 135597]
METPSSQKSTEYASPSLGSISGELNWYNFIEECLQKRNIYIEDSEPPVDLMRRSQSIIQRSRESPELDDAVVQKLREKSRRLRNASEDVIIKQLGPHLIPAMNEVPDVRVEMNADQLWFNSVPVPLDADVLTTPLPLPKAKPDLAFGYSQAAFTHKQLMTIDLLVDNNFGRSYAVPDQKIRFPFLIVEFKSQAKNGTHHIATNQAAGAGAIALNGTLELMQRSHKIQKFNYNEPQFFSVTMDHELARINVHWVKAPDAGEPHSFHVEGLSKHLLDDENGIRALSRAIKNIIDHCVDRRLQDLCEALDAYRDDVLANRSAANHLQVPRDQDDDCRQSIQADVLQAKVLPSGTVRECHDHCPVKAAAIPSTPQEGGRASRRETRSMRTIGPGPANRKALASSSNAAALSDSFRVIRKRNRVPLSCAPCRHRKLKCNRQSPCDNCTKRDSASACTYAAPAPRKKGSPGSTGANATPDDMQNRIDRLEGLVLSLMTNGASSAGPTAATQALAANAIDNGSGSSPRPNLIADPDDGQDSEGEVQDDDESDTEHLTKSFGILKVDQEKGKTIYIGDAHWGALLQEIAEVKNYFFRHKQEYEAHAEKVAQTRRQVNEDVGAGPGLLFGATVPPSRAEILAEMPSRYMSDILIRRYFSTFDPATNILHIPAFYRQYNAHWQDPSKTSIVWVAMLFAIMRLSMISYAREGDEPPELRGRCHDMAVNFRTQMAHCLVTADYTKPHNHTIETLIFHLHAEYTSNRDAEASIWVLVGMIARLAMRMGYHRDPKLFPNLTPFQGEMRRRIWTFVRGADLLFSFQAGLPAMVRMGDSDTGLPNNLFDDDFDEDSTVLPPSRPEAEATPVSYMIAKGKLAFGFGRVVEEINGVNRKGYEEVLKIDRGLREVYEGIPDYLKLKSMQDINLTPMSLGMARFSLATMYHKSQCVLHNRYMRLARANNRYNYSRRVGLDSAMQLLHFQAVHHRTTMERARGGGLSNHVNSLTTHDFSLAATVLGMDLYYHREKAETDFSSPSTSVSGASVSGGSMQSGDGSYLSGLPYSRSDLVQALEYSLDVWRANQDLSVEAFKTSKLLEILLQQIRSPSLPLAPSDGQSAVMTPAMQTDPGMSVLSAQPNGQWGTDKAGGLFSQDDSLPFGALFGNMGTMGTPSPFPTTILNGDVDGGANMNLDWEMWDQYMQGSNINIALDPAANLWGGDAQNMAQFGMHSRYYDEQQNARNINASPMDMGKQDSQMPALSANSPDTNQTDASAGEVFMGLQSPQPGGRSIAHSQDKMAPLLNGNEAKAKTDDSRIEPQATPVRAQDNAVAEKGSAGAAQSQDQEDLPRYNHNGHKISKWIHPEGESGRNGFQILHFFKLIWRSSSTLASYTNVLWPFVPAAIALHFVGGEHHVWTFAINYIAMVPAANLLGYAGQELSRKLPKVAGILIETCLGSVVEIVLLMVLVSKDKVGAEVGHGNLTYVIQAAILGSILTNLLLCLGGCFLVGGMRHREQTFHAVISETGSGILLVAGFALLIPSAFYSALSGSTTDSSAEGEHSYTLTQLRTDTLTISHGVACILVVAFGTFIVYNAISHDNIFNEVLEADGEMDCDRHKNLRKAKLTFTEAVVAILLSLTLVSLIAVFLVEEIEYIVVERHVPDNFVPLVEKAAEHLTTIDEAYDNQINGALFHCIGPSIQTALFNGPLAVIVSWGLGKSLDLNFEIFMVVVLVLSILVVGNFLRDGSSNWLEGALLIIVYAIIALTTWYYPNAELTTSNGATATTHE